MSGSFAEWWQHIPYNIDPYIVEIGSFRLGYYGLMYVVAFAVVYLLSIYRIKKGEAKYTAAEIESFLIWGALGMIVGARIGYVLFYNFAYYVRHPLEIVLPFSFEGGFHFTGIAGMSYHGGIVGLFVIGIFYCRKYRVDYWELADFLICSGPLGYTFGRIGNFINGELYGRATDVPWGMYFPSDPEGVLRHPSQLYEAFFEGLFIFAILWTLRNRHPFKGYHVALYVMLYGTVRFFIEFVRQPDEQLGTVLGPFSMGQVLCTLMVLVGAALFVLRKRAAR
jgi:phosphatidylglycerol:prolipoprotein diacylglycerol transferase